MLICLFDIDGTLVHTGGAGALSLREALRTGFGVAEPTQSVPIHGRTDRGITRDLFRHHGIDDQPEHWERFRAEYLRHLAVLLKQLRGTVLPGIVALLDQLRDREDVVLGLLTGNTRQGAQLKLRHYAIDQYFDLGGFGDVHYERDDVAREALAAAESRLGAAANKENLWVIGDTPADVTCARAIGAKVLAVATGHHNLSELEASRPDYLAADLSDSAAILRLWGR